MAKKNKIDRPFSETVSSKKRDRFCEADKIKKVCKRLFLPSADHFEQHFKQLELLIEDVLEQNRQIQKDLTEYRNVSFENEEMLALEREILWSRIFNDSIVESKWLKYRSFSLGRWAACYAFMYILFRVLDEAKPESILETGLGQTTKMISQFAMEYGRKHIVIEQDADWIAFFKRNYVLSSTTRLMHLPAVEINFLDDNVLVYEGFSKSVQDQKFNLICIDGPGKSKAKKYLRIDLLEVIPDVLAESWVILWDDYDLLRAQSAYHLLIQKLNAAGIGYAEGEYKGSRTVKCLCSNDLGFLTTL